MGGPGAAPGSCVPCPDVSLSVVIPTLDEADALPATLAHVAAVPEVGEVLVADGGSRDATEAIARSAGAQWVTAPRGRGAQLRAGAARARGDVVVLLHADTWLPPEAGRCIATALRTPPKGRGRMQPPVVGGGFHKVFRDGPWLLRRGARARSALYFHLTGRYFGDQALFVRRDVLERIGGVPPLPLMEDLALSRVLGGEGLLVLVPSTVSTSGRTFAKRGVLGTWWLMASLQWGWWRGVSPEVLAARYRRPSGL